MIRKCTSEDLDWLMGLAKQSFGSKVKDYSVARTWVEKALSNSKILVLRTDDSALLAMCGAVFFDPKTPTVSVQFFAGSRKDVEQLFQVLKPWAKGWGASEIYFQPRTGYNAQPLAESIGAEIDYPAFVWRI